jgi:hypothetical protein
MEIERIQVSRVSMQVFLCFLHFISYEMQRKRKSFQLC